MCIPFIGILSNITGKDGAFSDVPITNEDEFDAEASGYWTNDSFVIDDAVSGFTELGIYNWNEINETLICNGSGTLERPFIIENVTIDANGGSGLTVRNSNEIYFIIRNCTFINAGTAEFHYDIEVISSDSGAFTNNTLTKTVHSAYDDGDNTWYQNTYGDYDGYDTDGDHIGETPYDVAGGSNSDPEPITYEGDPEAPDITILSPTTDEVFGTTPPEIELEIDEYELDEVWYRLKNATIETDNETFTYPQDSVSQSLWDEFTKEGAITIEIFANDSSGNEASAEVSVLKDVGAPELTIDRPLNNSDYAWLSPHYNITVSDVHLAEVWYTINDSATKYVIATANGEHIGEIDQDMWDDIPDGATVVIKFYAKDEADNVIVITIIVTKTLPPDDDPDPVFDLIEFLIELWNQLWALIISIIGGIFGVAVVYRYRLKKKNECPCIGQPDCYCDM